MWGWKRFAEWLVNNLCTYDTHLFWKHQVCKVKEMPRLHCTHAHMPSTYISLLEDTASVTAHKSWHEFPELVFNIPHSVQCALLVCLVHLYCTVFKPSLNLEWRFFFLYWAALKHSFYCPSTSETLTAFAKTALWDQNSISKRGWSAWEINLCSIQWLWMTH